MADNNTDIVIYRGDDTNFLDLSPITVQIVTDIDLTGYTGEFVFQSITKSISTEEIVSKLFSVNYTAEETASFYPGKGYATLRLFDAQGKTAVIDTYIIDVKLHTYGEQSIYSGSDDPDDDSALSTQLGNSLTRFREQFKDIPAPANSTKSIAKIFVQLLDTLRN